jgi:hypothetical protein
MGSLDGWVDVFPRPASRLDTGRVQLIGTVNQSHGFRKMEEVAGTLPPTRHRDPTSTHEPGGHQSRYGAGSGVFRGSQASGDVANSHAHRPPVVIYPAVDVVACPVESASPN